MKCRISPPGLKTHLLEGNRLNINVFVVVFHVCIRKVLNYMKRLLTKKYLFSPVTVSPLWYADFNSMQEYCSDHKRSENSSTAPICVIRSGRVRHSTMEYLTQLLMWVTFLTNFPLFITAKVTIFGTASSSNLYFADVRSISDLRSRS